MKYLCLFVLASVSIAVTPTLSKAEEGEYATFIGTVLDICTGKPLKGKNVRVCQSFSAGSLGCTSTGADGKNSGAQLSLDVGVPVSFYAEVTKGSSTYRSSFEITKLEAKTYQRTFWLPAKNARCAR